MSIPPGRGSHTLPRILSLRTTYYTARKGTWNLRARATVLFSLPLQIRSGESFLFTKAPRKPFSRDAAPPLPQHAVGRFWENKYESPNPWQVPSGDSTVSECWLGCRSTWYFHFGGGGIPNVCCQLICELLCYGILSTDRRGDNIHYENSSHGTSRYIEELYFHG